MRGCAAFPRNVSAVLRKVCGFLLLLVAMTTPSFAGVRPPTPEIDPGSAAGALTLFSSALLVLIDRRRRNS
jgi:hypothetical protein